MDYLDIVSPNQGVEVFSQWIPRARLGLHLRLSRLLEKIDFEDSQKTIEAVREYLTGAGVNIQPLTGLEQLRALVILSDLNRLQTRLSYLEWAGDPDSKEPPYTYPSRAWALWVHKLASRYGWARDDIFNLWPEEAAVYIQEIILAEYDEADERRALSEMAYRYDKGSNKSKFIPLPRPGWMIDKAELPKKIRTRKDMLPIGNVIKLSNLGKDDVELH